MQEKEQMRSTYTTTREQNTMEEKEVQLYDNGINIYLTKRQAILLIRDNHKRLHVRKIDDIIRQYQR